MALRKKKTVLLSVAASLFLVTAAWYWSVRTPYSTITLQLPTKSVQLPERQTGNEKPRPYNPAPRHRNHTVIDVQSNPIEAMYQRLVVLTAFSSNHFREALDMIGYLQSSG